jgi:hypothetical protein
VTAYPPIGTPRPNEPADALEQAKHGAWVGDRERRAWAQIHQDTETWADLRPRMRHSRMWGWRKARPTEEAA